ncbi:MAG: hypothetical protein IPI20_09310 [Rhodoferax sp.]|nr:hypothetical protein [Rhodoferax sp.]
MGSAYRMLPWWKTSPVPADGSPWSPVKSAAPDGSTLLLTPYSCTSVYPHIYSKLSDPFRRPDAGVDCGGHALWSAVGLMVPASVKTVKD